MREETTFNGITYCRYPDAKSRVASLYYHPEWKAKQNGCDFLHREIWKHHNGPIPEGYDIHHKDENPLNNDPSNLECLSHSDHRSLHALLRLERLQAAHAKWRMTDEAKEFYKGKGKLFWLDRKPEKATCQQCGKEYQTPFPERSKFCNPNCKQKVRRDKKPDHEERSCVICGKSFQANRYFPTSTCGRSCGNKKRWRTLHGN